jgi:hypothetical protein
MASAMPLRAAKEAGFSPLGLLFSKSENIYETSSR